jgi:pentatricopeptide repeat protein
MTRVSSDKPNDFESRDLPSVTRISQILLELGLLEPKAWAAMTTQLLQQICRISTAPGDYTTIESYENAMGRRAFLLQDLIGNWKIFDVPRLVALRAGDAAKAAQEPRPSSLDMKTISWNSKKGRPHLSIAALFPQYAPNQLQTATHAAIATFVLFSDPYNRTDRTMRPEIASFVDAVGTILSRRPPRKDHLSSMFEGYPDLRRYIAKRWPTVLPQLTGSSKSQSTDLKLKGENVSRTQTMGAIHRQIGQALKTRSLEAVGRTWKDFWGEAQTPSLERTGQLRSNPELFNYFIMAYMGMRQPKRAIDVWNCMVQIGIAPTLKTWNAMIDGCRRARNPTGLKAVWQKLTASGTQLDIPIWTARVSGLIELGEPEAGLAALDEMARLWNESVSSGKNSTAVRPTIQPVNAALVGLLRLDRVAVAKSLLGWAARQGIQPDIFTFNTLLRPMVRQGHSSEVSNIFAMMKKQNVEPDVATFTILLEGALSDMGDKSPEQQVEALTEMLRDIEASGIQANMITYAKMIHVLLQQGDRAGESVKAVLAHIWGQGLELTSHIYTMLAEHYFSRSPPDSQAVTALITSRGLERNRDIDRVFWERVIKGYCEVGEVDKALELFERLDAQGSRIALSTLHELLVALVRADRREAAAKMVDVAWRLREQPDAAMAGDGARFWKHRFWHRAQEYGLLKDHHLASFQAADSP